MRSIASFVLLFAASACSTKTEPPVDAGMEASSDAPASCFPSPRGFDPGFKNGAITALTMPLEPRVIVLDKQGRLLVGGAQGSDSFVARIAANGTVDTAFGTKGVLVQSFGATADAIEAIAVDAQDRIVVGGALDQGGSNYPFVARLTGGGAIDASFAAASSNTWVSTISLGDARAIAIDPGGGLYAMGTSHFVQRILDDGTSDPAFTLVQAAMGENIAGAAVADGVVVFDLAGTLTKYGKSGMADAAFGGPVFGAAMGGAFAMNGTGFIVSDRGAPAHVATIDDKGKIVAMSSGVAMSIRSIGVACDRIVLGGGSNGDAKIGLLGLDTKPVMGDIAVDSYPVAAPPDSSTTALFSAVQPDGRVIYLEGVSGTGSFEMARVSP